MWSPLGSTAGQSRGASDEKSVGSAVEAAGDVIGPSPQLQRLLPNIGAASANGTLLTSTSTSTKTKTKTRPRLIVRRMCLLALDGSI